VLGASVAKLGWLAGRVWCCAGFGLLALILGGPLGQILADRGRRIRPL